MILINPAEVRYIKLGRGGRWAQRGSASRCPSSQTAGVPQRFSTVLSAAGKVGKKSPSRRAARIARIFEIGASHLLKPRRNRPEALPWTGRRDITRYRRDLFVARPRADLPQKGPA